MSAARRASSIIPQAVKWIWEPYLPRHMLSILDGDPGCGKSYLTLALATALSTGAPFPGMEGRRARRPCRTLICNAEDTLEHVVVPRLMSLGADLDQIDLLGAEELDCFDDAGKALLREAVGDLRPRLFTVDTIIPYLPGGTNSNASTEVRPTLRWLAALCKEFETAGLILRHLRKAAAVSAIHAGQGSMDFIGTCRSGMIVKRDPADKNAYVFAHMKSNLSRKAGSWRYGFDAERDGRFIWLDQSELTADELVEGEGELQRGPQPRAREQAGSWVLDFLREKKEAVSRAELLAAAEAAEIAPATLDRALRKLHIRAQPGRGGYTIHPDYSPDPV